MADLSVRGTKIRSGLLGRQKKKKRNLSLGCKNSFCLIILLETKCYCQRGVKDGPVVLIDSAMPGEGLSHVTQPKY